jgi:hypothetical protein
MMPYLTTSRTNKGGVADPASSEVGVGVPTDAIADRDIGDHPLQRNQLAGSGDPALQNYKFA